MKMLLKQKRRSRFTKITTIYIIVCLSIVFLVACAKSTNTHGADLKDGGFLSGEPCGAPCFFNIKPGQTSVTQAKEVLKSLDISKDCEEFDNTSESGNRGIICRPILIVTFQNNLDVVSGIGFRPNQKITVIDAIQKYGNPNDVLVTNIGTPESTQYTTMMVYFDDIQSILRLPQQQGSTYKLDPTIVIDNISYSDADSYRASKYYTSPWKGFVEYEP